MIVIATGSETEKKLILTSMGMGIVKGVKAIENGIQTPRGTSNAAGHRLRMI